MPTMGSTPRNVRIATPSSRRAPERPAALPITLKPNDTVSGLATQTTDLPDNDSPNTTLYRALLRGLYDAILIVNKRGRIVDCNRRARGFFQFTHEDLCQTAITEVVSGMSSRILQRIQETLASGRFTVLDAYCVRRDRTRFPVEIAISRLTTDERDDLVFSVRNVTRRRAMEADLRTEHNALQNSASGIVITDLDGRILYANPAFFGLCGRAEDNVLGQEIRDFWEPGDEADALFSKPLEGEDWSGEIENKPSGGRRFRVQATASPNRDSGDEIVGMVCSFVDITEKYEAEQRIRREAEAQIQSVSREDAFAGRLNIISLTDVFQLVHTTGKTGSLTVRDEAGNEIARVSFASGDLVSAEFGSRSGEDAVMDLLAADGRAFEFAPGKLPERDPSIQKSIMTLMMESAQAIDESD